MRDEDIEITVGRTDGGSFVRVKHLPSGRSKRLGPLNGEDPNLVIGRLVQELLTELREVGILTD